MARWIRFTGTNSWAKLHRGGDDGAGGVRFDLSPCPTVSALAGSLGGSARWGIFEDDEPEVAETFRTRRDGGKEFSFDQPAPTVQKFGIGDERPTSLEFGDDGQPAAPPDQGKPPYRVPLLPEIRAVPRNGLTVMSTFSGCGGSCLGFEWAGYTPLLAVEFVPAAVASYQANHPGVPVFTDDIRTLTAAKALKLMGLKKGELDVLEGSPPCESFSTAGRLSAGWGQERSYSDGKRQVMDDLFYEFVRLLKGTKPRAFVAENVAGLVRGVSKGYFKNIHAALGQAGYRVEARVLDAQWLGVPQRRQRVIFVGVRNDLKAAPAFPSPLPYRYSIRDALRGLSSPASVRNATGGGFRDAAAEIDVDGPMNAILAVQDHHHAVVDEVVGVTGRLGTGYERQPVDIDEPAPTMVRSEAAQTRFEIERAEVIGVSSRTGENYAREDLDVDEPVKTIAKDSNIQAFQVERAGEVTGLVYENGGGGGAARSGRAQEDLDAPARAITNAGGAAPLHFQVERAGEVVGLEGGWPNRPMSVDEPAATIGKGGYSGGQHQVVRVYQGGKVNRPGSNHGGRPSSADLPCPTIQAQSVGGSDKGGMYVERESETDVVELRHPNRGFWLERSAELVVDADEPAPTIVKGGGNGYEVVRAGDPVEDGQPLHGDYTERWGQLGPGEADPEHHDLVRSDPEAPVATITRVGGASNRSSATHPDDPRKFSIAELRRLCGFPDDFELTGSYAQQWERLGNSVPPPMMFHVACAVRDRILTPGR